MSEEDKIDYSTIGIIDESEPVEPEPADADYVREANSDVSDKPSGDLDATADTGDKDEPSEGDSAAEEQSVAPEEDTQAEGEGGEDGTGEESDKRSDASQKYQFGGKEWDSIDQAEQAFKSWDGRIKAEQEKAEKYALQLSDYYEYVQKVGKENEELRATKPLP